MFLMNNLIEYWQNSGIITDKKLIKAFKDTPRDKFVMHEFQKDAYGDYPLPIPGDQTISQPTTVMMMIQALELKKTDVVLDIGAGSGWNAAIMSKLCKKVYSVEIVPELVKFAKNNLKSAGVKNVEVIQYDGSLGYPKSAPYDKIICTAAAPKLLDTWIEQLNENGIIVAPVGEDSQIMIKARKIKGEIVTESLGDFMFVPLRGKYGF